MSATRRQFRLLRIIEANSPMDIAAGTDAGKKLIMCIANNPIPDEISISTSQTELQAGCRRAR